MTYQDKVITIHVLLGWKKTQLWHNIEKIDGVKMCFS